MKQNWLVIILVGAMLEQLIRHNVGEGYIHLFDLMAKYPENKLCQKLLLHQKWCTWKKIIVIGEREDNGKL